MYFVTICKYCIFVIGNINLSALKSNENSQEQFLALRLPVYHFFVNFIVRKSLSVSLPLSVKKTHRTKISYEQKEYEYSVL